jgi:cell volume regulation protein A
VNDQVAFGFAVLVASAVGMAAVLSSRVSERLRIPAPAIFLIGAAAAAEVAPRLGRVSTETIEDVVTVALAVILFDGGLRIGWRRLRTAAAAVVWLGVVGTLLTAGALAWVAHAAFALDWRQAMLLGTALAPTDPAVVFSVLGRREVAGRTGVLLEGESGANDPVGIALLVGLLATSPAASAASAVGHVAVDFVLQMVVGLLVGVVGGRLLLVSMRRIPLPGESLYPLRVLFGALAIYGLAAVAHGSGFLAVLVAGVVIGDERAPHKADVERFHSALGSLAEIVAFVLLGLSVDLRSVLTGDAWWIGLGLAVALTVAVRPVVVGGLLLPVRLRAGERAFVAWTGLKGAVPILLGVLILRAGAPGADGLYEVIFVVVAFSVVVQGGLMPTLARRLGVPLRTVEPEPWSLGVRFRDEPEGVHRFTVVAGAPADGAAVADLDVGEDGWVSLVIRAGTLLPVRAATRLRAGDEVVVLADPRAGESLRPVFAPAH